MRAKNLAEYLTFAFKNGFNTLITGPAGAGKTSLVEQACEELGYKLIVSHPVVSDPTDYKGLPFAQDGEAKFLPYGELKQLIHAEEPTVYFLDDFGQASEAVQKAAMQILLARAIGEHKVSDFVRFVSATNRRQDMAGVAGILSPVKSRFASIIDMEVNVDDWCTWALDNNMPVELVGFIKNNPAMLTDAKPSKEIVNTVSPRTLAHVGKLMNAGLPEELEYEVLGGAAGEGFVAPFRAFLKLWREMPDLDDIIKAPKTAKVPEKGKADLEYSVALGLASRMSEVNIDAIITYMKRLAPELSVVCIKEAMTRKKELAQTETFRNWCVENHQLIM